jgi:putative hydrolase of the HAD superfamily
MVSAVLFDLYGTLVDIEVQEDSPTLWRSLAQWVTANLDRPVSGNELHRDYVRICQDKVRVRGEGFILPEVFQELLGDKASERQVRSFASEFRRLSTKKLELRPYTIPLLTTLRAEKYRLALVSNTESIVTYYDLDHYALRPMFDAVILSSDAGVAKPDPEILRKALSSISATASDTVFVGDNFWTDAAAATALGMPCVLLADDPERVSAEASAELDKSLITFVAPTFEAIYTAVTHLTRRVI